MQAGYDDTLVVREYSLAFENAAALSNLQMQIASLRVRCLPSSREGRKLETLLRIPAYVAQVLLSPAAAQWARPQFFPLDKHLYRDCGI